MKFHKNPIKGDELCDGTRAVAPIDVDPIDPKLGHYYLFDEARGRVHAYLNGESKFQSEDRARFVRSCSTMWPFLKIYRHWEYSKAKQEAVDRKRAAVKFLDECDLRFKA